MRPYALMDANSKTDKRRVYTESMSYLTRMLINPAAQWPNTSVNSASLSPRREMS